MLPPSDQIFRTRRKLSRDRTPPGTPNMAVHLASNSSKVKADASPPPAVAVLEAGSTIGTLDARGSDDLLDLLLVDSDAAGALGNRD